MGHVGIAPHDPNNLIECVSNTVVLPVVYFMYYTTIILLMMLESESTLHRCTPSTGKLSYTVSYILRIQFVFTPVRDRSDTVFGIW